MYSDPRDPWLVIFILISYLSLVLCCDIHRSTLISIMYPACMITVHDRKSRALQVGIRADCLSEAPNHYLVEVESRLCKNEFTNLMFGLRAHIIITPS